MNMEPRLSNTMTEEEYDREREQLRETYGRGIGKMAPVEARAKADMAICKFFIETGWPQERLAKKEGVSDGLISYRLLFGRFLCYFLNAHTKLPQNLTERCFNKYWKQTDSGLPKGVRGGEFGRRNIPHGFGESFDEVIRMIEEDTVARSQNRPKIGKDIVKHFADDAKWHPVADVAAKVEAPEDHVAATLGNMVAHRTYGCKCEKREIGKVVKFRIFFEGDEDRVVAIPEMTEKLRPLIERLMAEGKKNMATMSPPAVLAA